SDGGPPAPRARKDLDEAWSLRPVVRRRGDADEPVDDPVAVEEPLEIRVGDEPIAVTMRTPGHDEELAAGFLWSEGIVAEPDEIESAERCREAAQGTVVRVVLAGATLAARRAALDRARRELFLSSSCGLCGKLSIDRVE